MPEARVSGREVGIAEAGTLLSELVRNPSINPPGNETAVAAIIERRLSSLGCETRIVESRPNRSSVIGRLRGAGDGPTLLFNGHMDVQPPGNNWTRDPFGAAIEGTRLFGQGAMDMKAGLTAIILALEYLKRDGTKLRGDILVTAVADEVSGGHLGTGFLVANGLIDADMAVVCEPTGDVVRVAHRGALWLEITVTGKSAHGGRPWLGVNALSKAAKIIAGIENDLLPGLQTRTHPLLPAPTINIGRLTGGTKFNLVADKAVLEIDRRMVPGESADAVQAEVHDLCERLRAADTEAWSFAIRRIMHVTPGEIDPEAPIVKACQKAHAAVTGTP
ncbi:MAG: M20 family metallopeptidase, partial [Proteobacteria bacterium]|nr:M20 family metallopeptidase [Pseudomonadota bacterium]